MFNIDLKRNTTLLWFYATQLSTLNTNLKITRIHQRELLNNKNIRNFTAFSSFVWVKHVIMKEFVGFVVIRYDTPRYIKGR